MRVTVRDGRVVHVHTDGDSGPAIVFHHGAPGLALPHAPWLGAAREAGFRWVGISRPGYGESARRPGRSVVDEVDDVTDVLDHLGVDRFVAVGWSGGGPHALACGARAGRCAGVVVLGGVAPYAQAEAAGFDWMAGMSAGNVEEFTLAVAGETALGPALESWREETAQVTAEQVREITEEQAAGSAQIEQFAETVATTFREGVRPGIDGWLDDDLAFVRDWGFALQDVAVPVAVWHGEDDRMVPVGHGRFIADLLPDARRHLVAGEGHLSIAACRFGEAMAEARDLLHESMDGRRG
jgi:pimeloyl-ACP methyl ester carboxylesterase